MHFHLVLFFVVILNLFAKNLISFFFLSNFFSRSPSPVQLGLHQVPQGGGLQNSFYDYDNFFFKSCGEEGKGGYGFVFKVVDGTALKGV